MVGTKNFMTKKSGKNIEREREREREWEMISSIHMHDKWKENHKLKQ